NWRWQSGQATRKRMGSSRADSSNMETGELMSEAPRYPPAFPAASRRGRSAQGGTVGEGGGGGRCREPLAAEQQSRGAAPDPPEGIEQVEREEYQDDAEEGTGPGGPERGGTGGHRIDLEESHLPEQRRGQEGDGDREQHHGRDEAHDAEGKLEQQEAHPLPG